MTDRYVGPGGNDGNSGLTWALRKLTLNGAEDTPVVAGDTVYVGPGVYREVLTCDVSGTSGNPITYIADVTGENTDDIGGIIRITGSDNDQTITRANCIDILTRNFRTFRGFAMDSCLQRLIDISSGYDSITEDCYFFNGGSTTADGWRIVSSTSTGHILRRCMFVAGRIGAYISASSTAECDTLVENCLFIGQINDGIRIERLNGVTIKNCTIFSPGDDCIDVAVAIDVAGNPTTVNNCILVGADDYGLEATITGEIVENYNSFFGHTSGDRLNTATGANSNTFMPVFTPQILKDGILVPNQNMFSLSEWSQIARIAGTGEATDDLFGVVRPTVSAKKSWGAIQLREAERETGTVRTGSAALTLADAGDHQIYVPITATSTTFSVYGRYESEYAGTLPRLIVRQPGQADQVDTMVAAADTWEQLSLTFTPNADPPYVVVIFRSLNTSVTGDFDTYWDDLDVS